MHTIINMCCKIKTLGKYDPILICHDANLIGDGLNSVNNPCI